MRQTISLVSICPAIAAPSVVRRGLVPLPLGGSLAGSGLWLYSPSSLAVLLPRLCTVSVGGVCFFRVSIPRRWLFRVSRGVYLCRRRVPSSRLVSVFPPTRRVAVAA